MAPAHRGMRRSRKWSCLKASQQRRLRRFVPVFPDKFSYFPEAFRQSGTKFPRFFITLGTLPFGNTSSFSRLLPQQADLIAKSWWTNMRVTASGWTPRLTIEGFWLPVVFDRACRCPKRRWWGTPNAAAIWSSRAAPTQLRPIVTNGRAHR